MKNGFQSIGTEHDGQTYCIHRDLVEKALHLRCESYLSDIKSRLFAETTMESSYGNSQNQQRNYEPSVQSHAGQQPHQRTLALENRATDDVKNHLQSLMNRHTPRPTTADAFLQNEIQERYKIEWALHNSELKFRNLLQSAPDAIVIVNEAGIINMVNTQTVKMFGYSPQELTGQSVEILIPQPLRESHQSHRKRFFANPFCRFMGDGLELFAQTKSGETIPVEVALSPLKTHDEVLVTAAIRDISKRKQVEEELISYRDHLEELVAERTAALSSVNRELEAFSYTISHDLRAPLRSIDGFSLALLEDCDAHLPEDSKDHLRRIRGATQRMGQLIDEVLQLARVSRCELSRRSLDLAEIAKDIVADLQGSDPARRANIQVGENLLAKADESLIRVVLENLMDNAWKFTRRKDQANIIFDKMRRGKQKVFFVKDNGAGLDMQYVNKLFGPFQRLHSEKEFPGTGVGLATVQRIIQRHGGNIWVESELDKGATFYFTLS